MSPIPESFPSLRILNYATPVALSVLYIATNIFAWCTLRNERKVSLSKVRKTALVCTCLCIVGSYLAQALRFCQDLANAPDDALVHSLSQILLWITLSLILVNTRNPLPLIWISVPLLNLILEITICALTYLVANTPEYRHLHALGGIDIATCVFLAAHAILALLLLQPDCPTITSPETEPLIAADNSNKRSSITRNGYNGLVNGDTVLSSESDSEDTDSEDNDEEEDDDKEIRILQKQRLADSGSWLTYLGEFKVFLPYLIPKNNFRIQFYLGFLVINTLAERVLLILEPRQLGLVVDALTHQHTFPWKQILLWILLKVLVSSSCGVGGINELLDNRISAWSTQQLSIAAFDQVMSLSMSFHDEKDSGEIIKAIEQAGSLNSLLRALILEVAPGAIDIFVAMVYLTYLFDVYAMLIIIAWGIAFVFATYFITIVMTSARRTSSGKARDESKLLYESVSNWFTVSYFNRKKHIMTRLARAVKDAAIAELWSNDIYTYLFVVQELSEYVALLAITVLAARRILQGTSSVGDFVTLEAYWFSLTLPLYSLGRSYRKLNSDLVDAERLLQLFKQQPVVKDISTARPVHLDRGEVVFDNVEFAYPGRATTIKNLNFTTKAGQMVAFVGETGSGKSTIFKLLMRFHDVTDGSIKLDGQDLRDVTLDSLRECFGFVPQDTVLFNMSILENVRYGRLDATDDEIYAACRAASIHDKILSFPKGYASKVGERGVKLSGGERQRIAIARVFLKNASIVLLDEATSAMDSETEAKIQTALKTLVKGRTTFVIAHRLSTIIEADKILVIDSGRVVESGTHQELLLQNGRYMELWRKQSASLVV